MGAACPPCGRVIVTQHHLRALDEPEQRVLDRQARLFESRIIEPRRHRDRGPDGDRDRGKGPGHEGSVPAPRRPCRARRDMKRHNGVAGGLRQPDAPGLHLACGAARAVDSKRRVRPGFHLSFQVHKSPDGASRRGAPGGAVTEPVRDACRPLAVEVLTGEGHDIAIPEEQHGGQQAPVPERHHGKLSTHRHGVEVLVPVDAPSPGPA